MAFVINEKASPAVSSKIKNLTEKVFNPFYSPSIGDDGDQSYQYAQYKVYLSLQASWDPANLYGYYTTLQPSFPDIFWEPLNEVRIVDRGLLADPSKRHLLSAAQKVKHLTPAIGTEILGVDLRQLSVPQKDELWVLNQLPTNSLLKLATSALLVAERGVVCMCSHALYVPCHPLNESISFS
jgi:sulfonate dioxygenase